MTRIILLLILTTQLALATGQQLTGAYAPAATAALSPAESQKAFKVPPGFEVCLFASEPDIVNPVAMTWDERGRLWVVELLEYPLGAPKGAKPRDRIKILEDADGDGRADKITIFADGLNLATGIALGNGGVYVGQAPDLLFLRDTNHDDHADTREVLLTGFDTNDRHELLNGFTWGPDGWLYMTHGVFNHSKIRHVAPDNLGRNNVGPVPSPGGLGTAHPHTFEASEPGVEVSAALCRYHPITKKFEVFADGTSNPWGVDFDASGNAFVSACVIDHLFHLAPGGIYQRQAGAPENPYAYELLPSIVHHKHYMAAYCGICIYQGDMFPPEYQGEVFMGNIHQCAINHDHLIPNGSSFKAVAKPDFLTTTDGWFRPVSEQVGPDGAMWIADWYDKYPCYQNAQADPAGVDRTYGRIWRVVYNGARTACPRPTKFDLSKASNEELIKLLAHCNEWQRRTARRLLIERARSNQLTVMPALLNTLDSTNSDTALAAFAVLNEFHGVPSDVYWAPNVVSGDETVHKLAAARHIGATRDNSDQALHTLEILAQDKKPSVRLAVAVAVRQIVSDSLTVDSDFENDEQTRMFAGKVLTKLIESCAGAKDPLLPFMIWTASEPLFAAKPAGGLKWLAENGSRTMPLSGILTRKAMRRICDTGEINKLDQAVDFLANLAHRSAELRLGENDDGFITAALDGMIEAQKTKLFMPTREVKSLFASFAANPDKTVQSRARELGTLWNDPDSISATLKVINDSSSPIDTRVKAIEVFNENKSNTAREALLDVIANKNPEAVVVEALRTLSAVGGDNVPAQILSRWPSLDTTARRAAIDTLVSRQQWANDFLNAVANKTISQTEISAPVFRTLENYKDPKIDERAKELFGRFRESSADKLKLIRHERKMVLQGDPDIAHGHEIAKKTCFICHKLYGEGASVGPDLTGVGRSSLDALLNNVIDPNQIVGKGYENVEVETKDGRSLSGRMVENDATHIKLLSAGPKEEVVPKSNIDSMRVSQLSVMPEGLQQMPDKDFRDLIWYILDPPGDNRPLTRELKKQLSTSK